MKVGYIGPIITLILIIGLLISANYQSAGKDTGVMPEVQKTYTEAEMTTFKKGLQEMQDLCKQENSPLTPSCSSVAKLRSKYAEMVQSNLNALGTVVKPASLPAPAASP